MRFEPFRLERYFAATEFTTPHLLAVSDCETRSIGALLDLEAGAAERFRALALTYTDSDGADELREAIAARYQSVGVDDVLVHATAVEALYTSMRALVQSGDRVVVQMPAYQALWGAAQMAGAEIVPWWARPDCGWSPDLDELSTLLEGERTRLLVMNAPHNPTGWNASEDDLRRIAATARRAGVRIVCDEAYRGTEFRAQHPAPPSMADLDPGALVLGLVSKGLGLPGLRTGWLISRDRAALDRVRAYKDFTSICGPAPSEFLSALALRHAERILTETRALLSSNLALLEDFVATHEDLFDWVPPRAGSVTFPFLRHPERWGGAGGFCDRVRAEAGVLLAPGALFVPAPIESDRPLGSGPAPSHVHDRAAAAAIRIGIGRASFGGALDVFGRWLEKAPERPTR